MIGATILIDKLIINTSITYGFVITFYPTYLYDHTI